MRLAGTAESCKKHVAAGINLRVVYIGVGSRVRYLHNLGHEVTLLGGEFNELLLVLQ